MPKILALQGATHRTNESLKYQLDQSVDIDLLAQQLSRAALTNEVVSVAAVFANLIRPITLYIRPAAWALWTLYELDDDEMRNLPTGNLLADIAQQLRRQQAAKDE
jgi:hypothetical protein